MIRKDCEQTFQPAARRRAGAIGYATAIAWLATIGAPAYANESLAGSIRLWPSAVVVSDSIRLDDLCELRGFNHESEQRIAGTIIADAPSPGGSRVIHLSMIRETLIAQGVNQAGIKLGGAVRCDVTRPAVASLQDSEPISSQFRPPNRNRGGMDHVARSGPAHSLSSRDFQQDTDATLRRAVIEYFNNELARYHGSAEVVFDRTSEQILELSGPDYEFRVRRQNSAPLGLIPIEVDVITEERVAQSVPFVVNVTLLRPTVVARRAINQSATIQSGDVEIMSMRYTVLNQLGMDDTARVVGQRAKRMIQTGSVVEPCMLEAVPLVVRGQLVSISAVSGGVQIVTTAKAAQDGLFGEIVKVRAADNRRIEFDAVVVGPGKVRVGDLRIPMRDIIARKDGS